MLDSNLKHIQTQIELACASVHRPPESVTLVAVTKSVDAAIAAKLPELGIYHLAENRVDKMIEKQDALSNNKIIWHMIGNLQRRKVKLIINRIDYFHALDSLKLAAEINKRAEKTIKCFVEVNIAGEESKQGLNKMDVLTFIEELQPFENIEVVGLMTMAPYDATDSDLHQYFHELQLLQETIAARHFSHAPCTELSMGMSNDYPIAIAEGATFVRIGTALYQE